MTRMKSEIVSAIRPPSARKERRLSETRRTRYLRNANGLPEDTLGVVTIFPFGVSLFAYPEHLSDEHSPLKEEENGDS